MKQKTFEVKSKRGRKGPDAKRELIGSVVVNQWESLGEAVADLGTEEKVLDLANTQHATNAKNKLRASVNQKVSETKLRSLAVEKVSSDRELLRAIVESGEDTKVAIEKAVLAEIEALRAELEMAKATAGVAPEVEDEDEEEEEEKE